jgi:hypothetical protein
MQLDAARSSDRRVQAGDTHLPFGPLLGVDVVSVLGIQTKTGVEVRGRVRLLGSVCRRSRHRPGSTVRRRPASESDRLPEGYPRPEGVDDERHPADTRQRERFDDDIGTPFFGKGGRGIGVQDTQVHNRVVRKIGWVGRPSEVAQAANCRTSDRQAVGGAKWCGRSRHPAECGSEEGGRPVDVVGFQIDPAESPNTRIRTHGSVLPGAHLDDNGFTGSCQTCPDLRRSGGPSARVRVSSVSSTAGGVPAPSRHTCGCRCRRSTRGARPATGRRAAAGGHAPALPAHRGRRVARRPRRRGGVMPRPPLPLGSYHLGHLRFATLRPADCVGPQGIEP